MTIKDQIFKSPIDIPGLLTGKEMKEGPKSPAACVDSLFINFMYYAKQHWSYIASSQAGGEALLNGTAVQVPCGGIANALKMLIEEKLQQQVSYITISGYVWTKPSYLSFDLKVKGNVSKAESPSLFNEGCFFNEHYFIKCGAKFYDPCLNSTYISQNDAIRKHYLPTESISRGSVMPGETVESVLVFQPNVIVSGWQRGAWLIVKERDILRYVTDKSDLMLISIKIKTGALAMAARKASRALFEREGRLEFWIQEHRKVGIQV